MVDVISIRNACEILYGYMLIMKLTDYFVDDYYTNAFNVVLSISSTRQNRYARDEGLV